MALDSIFWLSFVTITSGMIIKIVSMAYKSKCKECEFFCIKVKRDVALEEREREFELTHKQPSGLGLDDKI
jgi:hypothetical protein